MNEKPKSVRETDLKTFTDFGQTQTSFSRQIYLNVDCTWYSSGLLVDKINQEFDQKSVWILIQFILFLNNQCHTIPVSVNINI